MSPPLRLFQERKNFGDNLNNWIHWHYTGSPLHQSHRYCLIGSILRTKGHNAIVWGSGADPKEPHPGFRPKRVCAVRGKLSRKWLLDRGIDCPEIYGDPALFLPEMYSPKVYKRYQLGFVPHKADGREFGDVLIHPERNTPMEYIKKLLSCDVIASSSLHGLITADAYGIPSVWIWCERDVPEFKWHDYYSAVGLKLTPLRDSGQLYRHALGAACIKPKPDLELLRSVRPFGKPSNDHKCGR